MVKSRRLSGGIASKVKLLEPISAGFAALFLLLTQAAPWAYDRLTPIDCYYTYEVIPNPLRSREEALMKSYKAMLDQFPIPAEERPQAHSFFEVLSRGMVRMMDRETPEGDNLSISVHNVKQQPIKNLAITIASPSKLLGYTASPVVNWHNGTTESPVTAFPNGIMFRYGTIPSSKAIQISFGFENLTTATFDMIGERASGEPARGRLVTIAEYNQIGAKLMQSNIPLQMRLLQYLGVGLSLLLIGCGMAYRRLSGRLDSLEQATDPSVPVPLERV